VIRQSVGTTPVMLGRKLGTSFYVTDRYVEVKKGWWCVWCVLCDGFRAGRVFVILVGRVCVCAQRTINIHTTNNNQPTKKHQNQPIKQKQTHQKKTKR
jgi:hypothetical protein